jgi:hypothetical protein
MSSSSSLPVRAPFSQHNQRNATNNNNKGSSSSSSIDINCPGLLMDKKATGNKSSIQRSKHYSSSISHVPAITLMLNNTIDRQLIDPLQELVGTTTNILNNTITGKNDSFASAGVSNDCSSIDEPPLYMNLSGIFRPRLFETGSSDDNFWQQHPLQPANSVTEDSSDEDNNDDSNCINENAISSSPLLPSRNKQQLSSNMLYWNDCIFSTSVTEDVGIGERTTQSNHSNGCILQFR